MSLCVESEYQEYNFVHLNRTKMEWLDLEQWLKSWSRCKDHSLHNGDSQILDS